MLPFGPAQRVREVPEGARLTSRGGPTDVVDDVCGKENMVWIEGRAIVCGKRCARGIPHLVWSPDRGPAVIPLFASPEAKLVQQCRRPVSYTHLRAHETPEHLVCRLLL